MFRKSKKSFNRSSRACKHLYLKLLKRFKMVRSPVIKTIWQYHFHFSKVLMKHSSVSHLNFKVSINLKILFKRFESTYFYLCPLMFQSMLAIFPKILVKTFKFEIYLKIHSNDWRSICWPSLSANAPSLPGSTIFVSQKWNVWRCPIEFEVAVGNCRWR